LVIDCHGHYTTAPEPHNQWREAQKAAFKAGGAPPPYPAISDDEIRETIEQNQLRLIRERGADMTIFSPRASAMAHHVGDGAVSEAWAAHCNNLIARVVDLYPETFAGVCMLPQSPAADLAASVGVTSIPIPAAAISSIRRSPTNIGFRSTRRCASWTCRR
jgi:4-oxalmesaconate hydratase